MTVKDGMTANMAIGPDGRTQELALRRKSDNSAGLQLADLVISPIGRHLIGKPQYDDWRIVQQSCSATHPARIGAMALPCCHNDRADPRYAGLSPNEF